MFHTYIKQVKMCREYNLQKPVSDNQFQINVWITLHSR